jgi:hypothetical protein
MTDQAIYTYVLRNANSPTLRTPVLGGKAGIGLPPTL